MADDYNPHSSYPDEWGMDSNETSAWQQPQGQPQGPVQGEYAQQNFAYPQNPAPAQKSNTGLYVAVGIAGVVLAALVGVGGAYFLSNSSDNDPQSPNPVAAGESSSSTSNTVAPAPQETYTETYTETVEPESSSAPKTTPRGNFGQRAFGMNRNDIDAGGWVGSSAHCSGGYYARMLAETSSGKAVICENSNNRQQRHYIGDFGEISANPDAYTVESFSTNRAEAKNGDFTYTITPNAVTVTKNGEEIFRDSVTDFGVLNAG
ncbi:MAG: hypothetical protein Q4E11_08460 [Corynebacterium sp.]|uniref:hypothetical protein n=1 Tax=Corynebacterium sp. TaxID=1720 RepID=UPI0026DD5D3A|nr:hypothetical protein [Corynebacterium sp.]MDO5030598.1 hypothetical protein [Corynebacterium sp.]